MTVEPYPVYKASGVAWIGDLPWDWGNALQLRHLAGCLDSRRIPLNSAERADIPGDVPYWGSGGIVGSVERPLFDEELVLLGEDGAPFYDRTRPVSFRVDGPTWVNNHIHVLRPRKHVNPVFLVYALNSVDYSLYISGSTRDKLTQDDMWSIRVPVPPSAQQRQIADYLDTQTAKIDALIGKQERLIETLAERRQAVISHAVTKGLDSNVPMKDSGYEWLGQVPSRWTTGSLKRLIAKQQSGTSVNGVNTPADPNEIGVLKTSSVSTGVFDPDQNKAVVLEDWSRVTCPVTADTILVNRANSPERVGAAALVRKSIPNLYLSDKLWQITLAESDPTWLYWWLQTATYKDQVSALRVGTSSSMQNLSYEDFREIRVSFPEIGEQLIIAQYLDRETAQIDALSAKAREMIDVLKERRQALISAAVTGKIDVRGLS